MLCSHTQVTYVYGQVLTFLVSARLCSSTTKLKKIGKLVSHLFYPWYRASAACTDIQTTSAHIDYHNCLKYPKSITIILTNFLSCENKFGTRRNRMIQKKTYTDFVSLKR